MINIRNGSLFNLFFVTVLCFFAWTFTSRSLSLSILLSLLLLLGYSFMRIYFFVFDWLYDHTRLLHNLYDHNQLMYGKMKLIFLVSRSECVRLCSIGVGGSRRWTHFWLDEIPNSWCRVKLRSNRHPDALFEYIFRCKRIRKRFCM